ncbi:DUF1588 domain-containing protein [Bremerella sp.]|uniref:DUF1588 domain-containing protein n=1 Tax=Bremerella sp. TaxID=2795602 RepID=UPI003919580A
MLKVPHVFSHAAIAMCGVLFTSAVTAADDSLGLLVQKYCVRCHGGEEVEAAIDLRSSYCQLDMLKKKDVWNRVLEQLESESMPTEGPFPTSAEYETMISQIRTSVQHVDWQKVHHPGRIGLARLTTVEYRNSIRDVFGVDLQAGTFLGKDPEGNTGFSNDRDSLTFPLFAFDNFLREAERVVDAYLGFDRVPWSQSIDTVAAWKAASDGSVGLTKDGKAVLLESRNAPYQLNLDLPYSGMYRIEVRATTIDNEPLSATSIAINGNIAARIVVDGREPKSYSIIQNLPSGANVLSFGFDPDRAPIIQQDYALRAVPDSLIRDLKQPPIKSFPMPESLRNDSEAVRAWKKLNETIRDFSLTQRVADHLLEIERVDYERHTLAGNKGPAAFNTSKAPFNLAAGKVAVFLNVPQTKLEKNIQKETGFSFENYRTSVNRYIAKLRKKYPERAPRIPGSIALTKVTIASHALGPQDIDPTPKLREANQSLSATRQLIRSLGTSAYGRDIQPNEVDRFLRLYTNTREETGSHLDGLKDALTGLLVSPPFLLRYYVPDGTAESKINAYDYAERISRFLWLSVPDGKLREAAQKGSLNDESAIRVTIDQMIESPKFDSMAEAFVEQWLDLESLAEYENSRKIKAHTVMAMRKEPVLFFADVFRNNRSLLEFIDSDFTYLNDSLALHYEISGVQGQVMRPVLLQGQRRGGLLAMSGILTKTSTPNRTSPVTRGAFIVELLLGEELPPPPPDVPELKTGNKSRTIREELELHRQAAACAGCHNRIDPFGFVLEHYDQFGAWREKDRGQPISAATTLVDGTEVDGLFQFKKYLVTQRRDDFIRNLTERLFEFALGRKATFSDEAMIRRIISRVEQDNYSARSLVYEIVTCEGFQKQADPASN